MYSDDELLALSALQHMVFCERQCALIHVEGLWGENRFTAEGSRMHRRVHEAPRSATRGDARVCRGLRLKSARLGLAGIADVVEFHPAGENDSRAVALPGRRGRWRPFPVEYKRGRPKAHAADRVQLCAQGLCLEEMLETEVPAGALFYGRIRRRTDVRLDAELRSRTERAARRLHEIVAAGLTPRASPGPHCRSCSLRDVCRPEATAAAGRASRYLERARKEAVRATGSPEEKAT